MKDREAPFFSCYYASFFIIRQFSLRKWNLLYKCVRTWMREPFFVSKTSSTYIIIHKIYAYTYLPICVPSPSRKKPVSTIKMVNKCILFSLSIQHASKHWSLAYRVINFIELSYLLLLLLLCAWSFHYVQEKHSFVLCSCTNTTTPATIQLCSSRHLDRPTDRPTNQIVFIHSIFFFFSSFLSSLASAPGCVQ